MEFQVKTYDNSFHQGKRRVYFTCHPADFDAFFDTITGEILKVQDCAIYYTPDMSEDYDEDKNLEFDQMNLLVIPVTLNLLKEPCRAIDKDLAYALEKHILILPIMMESGLDELYENRFGKLEYLDRTAPGGDLTRYKEKLSAYLRAVLISDELAQKIRAAFDMYVFLSYRKKDKKYANELMRLIHANPLCRDIAVWYDEFLVPGENFEDSIREALSKSRLFTMVITPSITEQGNYIQNIEYPEARKEGKPILPVEMAATDDDLLRAMYEGIPDCVMGHEDDDFYDTFIRLLADTGRKEITDNPEHNFLIGLAYLEGVDVEKNPERGIALIKQAAEADIIEAVRKMMFIYRDGIGTDINWEEWHKWSEKLYALIQEKYKDDDEYLNDLQFIIESYDSNGDFDKSIELSRFVYEETCKKKGEEDYDTITALNALAYCIMMYGDYKQSLELFIKSYETGKRIFGESNPLTMASLSGTSLCYMQLGDYPKALEIEQKIYEYKKNLYGEKSDETAGSLEFIALLYAKMGDFNKAIELASRSCDNFMAIYGDDHPRTLTILNNLSSYYGEKGVYDKALEGLKKVYEERKKYLGEDNPNTLATLHNIGTFSAKAGLYEEAAKSETKVYDCYCRIYGKDNPNTLITQNTLAAFYGYQKNYDEAIRLGKDAYEKLSQIFGDNHMTTLGAKANLAGYYGKIGEYDKSLTMIKEAHATMKKNLGDMHPNCVLTSGNIVYTYGDKGDYQKALELGKEVLENYKKILGDEHPETKRLIGELEKYAANAT